MSQAIDVGPIDQILNKLEHDAKSATDGLGFTSRLLRQLRSISGATSAAFIALIDSDSESRFPSSLPTASWVVIVSVGESIDRGFQGQLARLADFPTKNASSGTTSAHAIWRENDRAHFAVPLVGDFGTLGAIVYAFPEPCPAAAEEGLLALLEGFAQILADRLNFQERRASIEQQRNFDLFLIELYTADRGTGVESCLAHDLPSIVKCERIAVSSQRAPGRWKVTAITGTPEIARQTETVLEIEKLATEAARSGTPRFIRAPNSIRLAPTKSLGLANGQVGLNDGESDTLLLPLLAPPSGSEMRAGSDRNASPVVLMFQWSESTGIEGSLARIRRLMPHVQAACSQIGRKRWWMPGAHFSILSRPRSLRLAILRRVAVAALVSAAIWMTLAWEVDFDIEAKGLLEPIEQRIIFATHDGQVERLAVEEGSLVTPGQILIELRSAELELRQSELEGEIATTIKRREGLRVAINQLDPGQRDSLVASRQLAAELESLDEKLRGLSTLQELARQQLDSLVIRCPIEGTVVTWDARRNLDSRPIRRGDSLLKVARIAGPWRLRLWVPDKEISHLRNFGSGSRNDGDSAPKANELEVAFQLVSQPGVSNRGKLISIGNTVQMIDDRGPVIPVDFAVDRERVGGLQVNATAIGRIRCGRRPWWYVWTRSFSETLRQKFWFLGCIT
jgi:hypothetical protein